MPDLSNSSKPPTFRELESFCRVVALGSYTASAEVLGTSPARVWQSVERLETKLGLSPKSLVRPSGPGGKIVPTPIGRLVAEAAKEAVEAFIDLRHRAGAAQRGERVELRVGCYPAHVEQFVADALSRFAMRFPDVPIRLHGLSDEARRSGGLNLLSDLAGGRVDVAIAPSRNERTSRLIEYPLYSWQLMAGLSAGSAKALTITDLRGKPVLLSPPGFRSRRMFEEACIRSGFEPRVYVDSSNTEALIALGAAGLGVPVIPSDAINRENSLDWVPVRDAESQWLGGNYSLYLLRGGRAQSENEDGSGPLLQELTQELVVSAQPLRSRFIG